MRVKKFSKSQYAGFAALFVAISCREQSRPTEAELVKRSTAVSVKPDQIRPEERFLFDLESRVVGFGGLYMNEASEVHVWVTAKGNIETARAAVTRTFLDGTLPRPLGQKSSGFVVDEALFTVSELAAWRDLVFDAVNNGQIPSAVSLDLDERLNRVRFVMDGPETIDQARAAIVKLGVPAAALSVERGTRPVDATASTTPNLITDQVSVIVGGIGTSWEPSPDGQSFCTVSFTATTNAGPRFVTASHCSSHEWSVDGSLMRNSPSVRQIGFETEDPAGYACGLRTCRGSDAAMYSYSAGIAGQVGLIARLNPGGSLQWNQSTPFWTISAAAPTNMFVGLSISKTGMITGWTSGQITHTCNDYFSSGTRTRTCQNDANVYLKKGDSGGPVFFENGMGSGYVTLAGITSAIGGWPNNNMIFSSFARVAQNLAIDAYDVIHPSLFPAQPVVTGSLSGNNPVLTWPSVPSAVSYRLLRQWYRYSNEQGSNGFEDMGNVTSPFSGDFLIVDAYTGTTIPNFSTEGYAAYQLIAYNSNGTPSRTSVMKYFRLAP